MNSQIRKIRKSSRFFSIFERIFLIFQKHFVIFQKKFQFFSIFFQFFPIFKPFVVLFWQKIDIDREIERKALISLHWSCNLQLRLLLGIIQIKRNNTVVRFDFTEIQWGFLTGTRPVGGYCRDPGRCCLPWQQMMIENRRVVAVMKFIWSNCDMLEQ